MRALRNGELLDQAFHRCADALDARERAWTHELVYGTVRLRGRLDHILTRFVKRQLSALDADVLDTLRLGAYQLLEMNGVPAYAAVSQSVELIKTGKNRGASGFVNGVLQSLRRAQDGSSAPPAFETLDVLASWGSHPLWLVERWVAQFGVASAAALVSANNQKPDVFLRVLGQPRDQAVAQLNAAGLAAQPVGEVSTAIRIAAGEVTRALALLRAVVQDPAAMMVTEYAGFARGFIADLCAAPGGKALALSSPDALVVAGDLSFARLQRLRENAARVAAPVHFFVGDARQPPFRHLQQVLIDAPCTGTGTLRRHPDGKWRLRPADIDTLAQLQQQILEGVAPLVSPGGLLVYATCSLEPEENELQVQRFLSEHPEFELEPASQDSLPQRDGMLRVLPHEHGFDGAFAARLRRAA